MGDKIEAKKIAKKYGLPVIEGSEGGVKSLDEAKSIAKEIGYPILIKAAGGGGGKGMKIVNEDNELKDMFLTPPSDPSMTGKPFSLAIFLAWILSPIICINFEEAPINLILFSSNILAKFVFSDKNP